MSRSLIPHSTQQAELTRVFRLIEDDLSSLRSMLKAFGTGPSRSAPSLGSVPSSSGPGPRGPLSDTGIDGITGLRAALDGKASQELASNDPNYAAYRTRFGTTVSQGSLEIREMVPALGGGRSVHVALGAWTAQAWTSDDFLPGDFAPAVHAHAISDTTGLQDALDARAHIDHTHTLASLGAAAASHQHGDADLTDLSWSKLTGVPSTFTPSSHYHTFDSLTSKPTTLAGYGIVDAALASHTHDYSGVFASISHGHPWADITSKPTAFPPEAHTHTTSEVTEGTNLYFAEARVRGTVLTGLNTSLAGTVSASDTILAAIGKLENRVAGFTASGVSSFNTRTGAVTLTSGDVTGALGYTPSADTHVHTFASLTSKPTTLAGYGITDAASSTHNHDAVYAKLSGASFTGNIGVKQTADHAYLTLDAATSKDAGMFFNQDGANKWEIYNTWDNTFSIYSYHNSQTVFYILPGGDASFYGSVTATGLITTGNLQAAGWVTGVTGQQIVPTSAGNYWVVGSNYGLIIRDRSGNNKGQVYFDSSGFGFLNFNGDWSVRLSTSSLGGGDLFRDWNCTGNLSSNKQIEAKGNGTAGGIILRNPSGDRYRLSINSSNELQLDAI